MRGEVIFGFMFVSLQSSVENGRKVGDNGNGHARDASNTGLRGYLGGGVVAGSFSLGL